MRKLFILFFALLAFATFADNRNDREVILHQGGGGAGLDQIYVDPPYVTYDDNLNELYVYFGSIGTIDIEYVDPSGTPYYFVYGENHAGNIYLN